MKGIVFNLLEDAVTQDFGPEVWDKLVAAAHSDGAYTSLGTYPDAHVEMMVTAAAKMLGKEPGDVLRWFGNAAIPFLWERYPQFFTPYRDVRELLKNLNHVIHPEVLKIYPGAVVPVLEFTDAEDGGLIMRYDSPRGLCALAEGYAQGAGAHYGERLAFDHIQCKHRGDAECLCRITFLN